MVQFSMAMVQLEDFVRSVNLKDVFEIAIISMLCNPQPSNNTKTQYKAQTARMKSAQIEIKRDSIEQTQKSKIPKRGTIRSFILTQ